jgi:uncharacterized membrane protein YhaH (DUF805 family)
MYGSTDSSALRGATFGQAVQRLFSKYADFTGRASRSEYWWVVLFFVPVTIVQQVLQQLGGAGLAVSLLISLALLVPSLAIGTRRLHDIGKSGWWQLLWIVIVIGWIILIVWYATAEKPEGDKYNV